MSTLPPFWSTIILTHMLMLRRALPFPLLPLAPFALAPRFRSSTQEALFPERLGILDSKYHRLGPLELRRPLAIKRLLGESSGQLDRQMGEVEKQRAILLSSGTAVLSSEQYRQSEGSPLVEEYLQRYSELGRIFRQCPLNSEWVYKAVGWFNVLPLYKPMAERLLASTGEETEYLLEALSWMSFKWAGAYGMIDEDLRERRQVEGFYRTLSPHLEIDQLRKLEIIVVAPLVFAKRRYYEHYVAKNLEPLLKTLHPSDGAGVFNLLWLFHRMVASMVDQEILIAKFEKFLLLPGLQLGEGTELLLRMYELKGRVNRDIYQQHLKPYLLRHKMKELGDIVESIKFAVCSECGDNALLKSLYELLQMKYQRGALKHSRYLYDLHLYTHYLRIKGYTIKLNKDLEQELTNFCRERNENRESLSRVVLDAHAAALKGKAKHTSECLRTKQSCLSEYPSTKRSVFESNFSYKLLHLKLEELKIYEKAIFCCFELDFCLRKQATNELMDVEIEGLQYVFTSGRMTRSKEIRDEILTHYGFKVIHVDYNTFKAKDRVTEDVVLMNKRFFENK